MITANEHLSLAGNIITQTRGFVKMFFDKNAELRFFKIVFARNFAQKDVSFAREG